MDLPQDSARGKTSATGAKVGRRRHLEEGLHRTAVPGGDGRRPGVASRTIPPSPVPSTLLGPVKRGPSRQTNRSCPRTLPRRALAADGQRRPGRTQSAPPPGAPTEGWPTHHSPLPQQASCSRSTLLGRSRKLLNPKTLSGAIPPARNAHPRGHQARPSRGAALCPAPAWRGRAGHLPTVPSCSPSRRAGGYEGR